jgi:hypothetical protein
LIEEFYTGAVVVAWVVRDLGETSGDDPARWRSVAPAFSHTCRSRYPPGSTQLRGFLPSPICAAGDAHASEAFISCPDATTHLTLRLFPRCRW